MDELTEYEISVLRFLAEDNKTVSVDINDDMAKAALYLVRLGYAGITANISEAGIARLKEIDGR